MRVQFTFLLLIFLTISCQNSIPSTIPAEQSLFHPDATIQTSKFCWGMWDITIDPRNSLAYATPLRSANFQVNVVNFLQPPKAPVNLIYIAIVPGETDFPTGKITCDISLKHPFPGSIYCGFDVMGIILDDYQPVPLASDPAIIASLPPDTLLQNPDGWTRWWNQAEFTTYGKLFGYIEGSKADHTWTSVHTLNCYKYFCDGLGADDNFTPSPDGRGFFSSSEPGINSRRYRLQFPMDGNKPVFQFKYSVSASWVAPYDAAEAPYTSDEFPPEANMPEAYKIDITDNGSSAYYENETTYGGDLNLTLGVYDWQFSGDLSSVAEEIKSVTIESPSLFPTPFEADLGNAYMNPLIPKCIQIPVVIEDVTPDALNNQLLIVTVNSLHPGTYEPQIPGITGFEYPDGNLAAYNIFHVDIKSEAPPNLPPIANAGASKPLTGAPPLTVNFDPSLSTDPDGQIVLYEWDFENDGAYDTSTVSPDVVEHIYDEGKYDVMLRVTDNKGATDTLDEPLHIDSHDYVWKIEAVDEGVTYSNHALGIDSKGNPRICYQTYEPGLTDPEYMKYAWRDETGWHIDDSGMEVAFVFGMDLDSEDHLHFVYEDENSDLVYGNYDGIEWFTQNWGYCREAAIRLDSKDFPHIAEGTGPGANSWGTNHMWLTATGWKSSWDHFPDVVDGQSIDLDSNDKAHITEFEIEPSSSHNLYYSVYEGSSWQNTLIASNCGGAQVRVDSQDHIHIAFTSNNLFYAFNDGSGWAITTVNSEIGITPSIAIDSLNRPHIAFISDPDHSVKYAFFNGTYWEVTTLPDFNSSNHPSIAMRPGDLPSIVFRRLDDDNIFRIYYAELE